MWTIKTTMGQTVTAAELRRRYPNMVAFDAFGWEVDLDELEAEEVADSRILFWPSYSSSIGDPGEHAIAEARWHD